MEVKDLKERGDTINKIMGQILEDMTKAEPYEEVPLSPDQKRIDTFKGRRFWLLAGKQVAGVAVSQ